MEVDLVAFFSFVVITSFTPGPNNIACASLGMLIGYKRSLRFIFGIVTGFGFILWICALLSNWLLQAAPFINDYLKYIGAAYIIWLAYQTYKASYSSDGAVEQLASFGRGFLLQLVNPKGIFYGMALFTTFLSGAQGNVWAIASWIFVVLPICLLSISTWALFGSFIQQYMQNQRLKRIINAALALALVLTAIQISDIFG